MITQEEHEKREEAAAAHYKTTLRYRLVTKIINALEDREANIVGRIQSAIPWERREQFTLTAPKIDFSAEAERLLDEEILRLAADSVLERLNKRLWE